MTEQQPTVRKTRFVCVSDTHNASPYGAFRLPKGDVLIHAGDMTNQGSISELRKTVKWLEEADFEAKIVIAGNHDITLDSDFYAQYGLYFHNQHPQSPTECQQLLEQSPSILWLRHESATVKLESPTGPQTTFKIFGSPMSPENGMWAFRYNADAATQVWDQIPLDSDIIVTHTPPKYHCDETGQRRAAGCEGLRHALWRVRPRLAVCGHIHEGRGVERVRWDLGSSNLKYKEESVERWEDPGRDNKKTSLVDLTNKGGKPIDNNVFLGDVPADVSMLDLTTSQAPVLPDNGPSPQSTDAAISRITTALLAVPAESLPAATRGQGGHPPSLRCDLEALSGRLGRRETCIVNAAIMASSWPHGSGGKKYNKPIVVDIDLPVWKE
ncbi:related to phosphoesterases [Phialocephala subalpina]|uniref:Related to phosphoesterases n=1 Tax=Phialocephala subalpina TaxID=576137 RepID=A0A1L7XTZ3_9HELO|nr:related to phosphoesterases [Phialocephala subalpina]